MGSVRRSIKKIKKQNNPPPNPHNTSQKAVTDFTESGECHCIVMVMVMVGDGDGHSLILLHHSKTDHTPESLLLTLDIDAILAVKHWIDLAEISDGYLLRGIFGKKPKQSIDPGQVSQMFKSPAVKAELNPGQISEHLTRTGAAEDLLDSGAGVGQIMEKVGWSKVDTVMIYDDVNNLTAITR